MLASRQINFYSQGSETLFDGDPNISQPERGVLTMPLRLNWLVSHIHITKSNKHDPIWSNKNISSPWINTRKRIHSQQPCQSKKIYSHDNPTGYYNHLLVIQVCIESATLWSISLELSNCNATLVGQSRCSRMLETKGNAHTLGRKKGVIKPDEMYGDININNCTKIWDKGVWWYLTRTKFLQGKLNNKHISDISTSVPSMSFKYTEGLHKWWVLDSEVFTELFRQLYIYSKIKTSNWNCNPTLHSQAFFHPSLMQHRQMDSPGPKGNSPRLSNTRTNIVPFWSYFGPNP